MSKKLTLEYIDEWLKENRPEFELCENNIYETNKKKLKLYHTVCQDYLYMCWNNIYTGWGCGVCHGSQVGKFNNLAYCKPEVSKEWHPTKNGKLTSSDVSYSSNKKVWWLCPNGHEYYSSVNNRVSKESCCKKCSDQKQESKIATQIKTWCKKMFKHFYNEEYPTTLSPKGRTLRCDIYLGKTDSVDGIYVEVHGTQHYAVCGWDYVQAKRNSTTPEEEFKYRKRLDRIKKQYAKRHGVYIEVDLRKIKTLDEAIEYIKSNIKESK